MAAAVHDTLPPEIHVCKARTCLAKGGDACLQEIEELAGALTEEFNAETDDSLVCSACAYGYSHVGLTGRCNLCPPHEENMGIATVGVLGATLGTLVFVKMSLGGAKAFARCSSSDSPPVLMM